ncbi:MAG: GntR family transcriptional regulator [Chloroflexi bacterium]|nr:GntR family transcriptional regulator [Chloroflexota bacterium]MBV9600272.1 GntR family transcriptional regulator [Chloroflexota bacterium]
MQRRKLGAEVTRALRQAILTGRYRSGDHVTEAEIAQQLSVSHGPVREALRELESEDLLVLEPHRGAFVKSFAARDIREVCQFRSAIETAAVNLALPELTESDFGHLDEIVDEMRTAVRGEDLETLIELDLEFHSWLCHRSGNRRMYEAWLRLLSPVRLFLTIAVPRYLSPHETAESHPPIVAALRAGDAPAATRHMECSVQALADRIAAGLEARSAGFAPRSDVVEVQPAPARKGRRMEPPREFVLTASRIS